MAASNTDKITDVRNAARPNAATVSSGRSGGGTTLACDNLVGWPTASKVHFITYQVDSNSDPVSSTQLDCYGIVSGNSITSMTVVDGSDTGNSIGDKVQMHPTAAWGQDLADALMVAHNRTGTHLSGATYPAAVLTSSPTLTTPTIADFTNSTHDHSTTAKGGNIPFAGLLSTIFSGQVQTQANAGTAGGTMYYVNLGGIKVLWMITASQSVGTGGATWTVTLPTSFFTTLQYVAPSLYILGTTVFQHVAISAANTTTVTIQQISDSNGSTQQNALLVIGT